MNGVLQQIDSWGHLARKIKSFKQVQLENIYKIQEKLKSFLGMVEILLKHGRNTGNQHFLLFPHFKKTSF